MSGLNALGLSTQVSKITISFFKNLNNEIYCALIEYVKNENNKNYKLALKYS